MGGTFVSCTINYYIVYEFLLSSMRVSEGWFQFWYFSKHSEVLIVLSRIFGEHTMGLHNACTKLFCGLGCSEVIGGCLKYTGIFINMVSMCCQDRMSLDSRLTILIMTCKCIDSEANASRFRFKIILAPSVYWIKSSPA